MALRDVEEVRLTEQRGRLKADLRQKHMSNMTLKLMALAAEWIVVEYWKKGCTGRHTDLKQKNISQEQTANEKSFRHKSGNISLTIRYLVWSSKERSR